MATKKTSGVTKIAKLILGGKTTSKQKTRKPSSAMNRMSTKIGQAFPELGINHSIKALSTSDFSDINFKGRLSSIASSINLDTRWSKLGREMAMQIDNESDGIVDVSNNASEEFDDVQHNFDIVQKQIGVLSQFMIRLDYKFIDLQRNIKNSIVKSNSEVVKNQIVVVDKVNKKLEGVDTNVKNIKQRIELHDRQLDELYAEFKAKNKSSKVHDFLVGKRKTNPFPSFVDSPSNKEDPEKNGGLGILSLLNPETIAAIGAMGAAGIAGAGVGAIKLGSKTVKGVGKGLGAANRIGARTGMRIGGKIGAKIGGRLIPGVGILLTAKDFYDGYKQDGVKGGLKNAATLGFAYDDDPRSNTDSKSVSEDIRIVSESNIILEAKKKLTLKADTIFFDAKKIEFAGNVIGAKEQAKTFEQKAQPKKGGWFGWGGFPGHESKAGLTNPSASTTSIGSGIGAYSGGSKGGLGTGDWNVNSAIANQKPNKQISKPESVLSDIISKSAPAGNLNVDKNNKVNPQELYNTLVNKFSKSSLNGFVPPDGEKWGITKGTPQEWAKFGVANARQESGFNTKSTNLSDPGGSFGLYQFNQKQFGLKGNAYDPNASTDAFVKSMEHYSKQTNKWGSGISAAGAIFGSIRRPNETLNHYGWVNKNIKDTEISDKAILPGMTKVAKLDDANRSLIRKSRQSRADAGPPPSRLDFKTQREYNAAAAKYEKLSGARASVVGNAKARGINRVDPRLVEIVQEASKYLPAGYRGEIYSGYRPGDRRQHGHGNAIDMRIIDPEGNVLENYQNSKHFRMYEKFAQSVKKIQSEKHPDLGLRWGGYFSGSKGKYGALDLMHFDTAEHIGMAGGSFERGLTNQQRKIWGISDSEGMGNISKFELPSEQGNEQAKNIPLSKRGLTSYAGMTKESKNANLSGMKAGEKQLEKINNVMQSVEAKRAEFHKNPDYKRRPDGPDKQTTYLNNLSDKQKKFALAKTETANPSLGKKLQIIDGRDRVVSLPGKDQWLQGGPKSAGPAWANGTGRTTVASKASLGGGFKRLSEVNTTKQNISVLKNKVAEVKAQPKQNVAQNGSISGGKKIIEKAPSKVVEESPKKSDYKVATKKDEPVKQSAAKSEEPKGYRPREEATSKSYNNSADSIPPSPSDDGSGDYKRCLI